MFRFLKILLALIVVLIAVLVAVPFLVPADKIKNEVLAQIEARTGRKVTADHVSFSIFPTLGLDAQNAKIGNPDWAPGNMAEIKTLRIGLELLPMLHGEYRLKELTLEQPVIILVKQNGRANWELGKAAPKAAGAQSQERGAKAAGSPREAFPDLHLDKITITDGTVTYKDDAKIDTVPGINLTLKAPDLRAKADIELTALYAGKKLEATLAIDKPLAFITGDEGGIKISIKANYAGMDWTGTATLPRYGVPTLTGKIDIASLDTADLAQKSESGAAAPAAEKPSGKASSAEGASRWSDAPIKFDALMRTNADLTVSIGKLTLPKTTLENIVVSLRLAGGAIEVQIAPFKAYGGTIDMQAGATSKGSIYLIFSAQHAEAEPLLRDFAGYDKLSGTIDTQARVAMSGDSERAFIGSLTGRGNIAFRNGKLRGVNLASLMRNLAGAQGGDNASTDFSELSASYTIARGIVTTNDIRLSSSLLHMSGAGTIDLPDWQDHLLLKPTLVASSQGQGGKDASGITVPVHVDGPVDHPHYQPDLQAALQENLADPSKLKGNLKNLQKTFLNKDALQNLLR